MAYVRTGARWVGTALTTVLVVLLLGVFTLSLAQRISSQRPLFGHMLLSVLSGSMTGTFNTGDAIVDRTVTAAQAENLKVGQIITYRSPYFIPGKTIVVSHRIVGIVTVRPKGHTLGRVTHMYVTKGDANTSIDPHPVNPAQIMGVYMFRVPYLGYMSADVRTPWGFGLTVGLPIVYLVGAEFLRLWRRLDEQERRALAAAPEGGDASH